MTREEIDKRAELLCEAIFAPQTGADDVETVARIQLLSLRRATLEEAARAACLDCERHASEGKAACSRAFRSDAEPPIRWAHYNDGAQWPCDAGKIHDLLAALDKEVK